MEDKPNASSLVPLRPSSDPRATSPGLEPVSGKPFEVSFDAVAASNGTISPDQLFEIIRYEGRVEGVWRIVDL